MAGRQRERLLDKPFLRVPGTDTIRTDKGCVTFAGFAEPSEFFYGLRRIDEKDGLAFRKGKHVFVDFPDDTIFRIDVDPSRCTEGDPTPTLWNERVPDFLKGPRCEAAYIQDGRKQSIEIGLAKEELVHSIIGKPSFVWWMYTFVARTKGLALRNPIVLSLYSRDGRKLAQFTLRL